MAVTLAVAGATAWTALVADTIWESAHAGGGSIVAVGRALMAPGEAPIVALAALAASAGIVVTATIAAIRGRRLERRMAEELDERSQQITARAAGDVARAGLLSWRVAELRSSMEELTAKREEVLAEMGLARRRTAELRALAEDYKRSLAELQDRLIVLPEIEDELARRRAQRKAAHPAR